MAINAGEISEIIKKEIEGFEKDIELKEVGTVISAGDGIARIYGLEKAMAGELLEFPNNVIGMALNLEEDSVGAVLFGDETLVKEGDEVKRTGKVAESPVGEEMIGRVVNALGKEIDGKGPIKTKTRARVDVKAPGIIPRKSVHEPMSTGLKAIDEAKGIFGRDKPAVYLKKMDVIYDGKPITEYFMTSATSPDPLIRFKMKADKEGPLKIVFTNSYDESKEVTKNIKFSG